MRDGNIEFRAAPGRNISLLSSVDLEDSQPRGFVVVDGIPVQSLVCCSQYLNSEYQNEYNYKHSQLTLLEGIC